MRRFGFLLLFPLLWLQACSSVSGPVHFYSGQPRGMNETARLKIPAAITITKIDGKEIEVPSKEEGLYDVYLLPGIHRIDFKYELAWGDNVSGMLIRSDIIGVETRLYAGMQYEFVYPEPGGQEEAYEMIMASEFKAKLIEEKTGRQVSSRPVAELDEFRMVSVNKSVNPPLAVSPAASTSPAGIDADTASREDAVKRLKFWWLMANEEERKQFRKWMKQVEGAEKTVAE